MLFATFKHHQSDFPLQGNDKFTRVKLVLKDSPPFIAHLSPFLLPLTSKRYQHYKESMFLYLLYSKS